MSNDWPSPDGFEQTSQAFAFPTNSTPALQTSNIGEFDSHRQAIGRVIGAIEAPWVKVYSAIRFQIISQRFLTEIGQYLPPEGNVLDAGCGFGLFTNYFAQVHPRARFVGLDLDSARIRIAREVAARLGVVNAEFDCVSLEDFSPSRPIHAAYMLDILHHVPRKEVLRFLNKVSRMLPLGGILVAKDLLTTPGYKALFALLLDRLMIGRGFVRYWTTAEMKELLLALGFQVFHHEMVDWLPYPHVIFIARKITRIDHERFEHEYIPAHLDKYRI
ncbi:MAG: class I SAM-dependent methyltransferase [Acidobacteria bacterium]|nr:MAG: class I SAM-dependent methyltransferase [Acidobacteriota bacterium]